LYTYGHQNSICLVFVVFLGKGLLPDPLLMVTLSLDRCRAVMFKMSRTEGSWRMRAGCAMPTSTGPVILALGVARRDGSR
jgi:hypothetical protein